MKNITLSIGIPAYNEEANIKRLLLAILAQKEKGFVLKEILVVSDGSSDRTVEKAKEIKDKRIKIVDDKKRLGKSERMNHIFSMFKGEVLFLIDADVTFNDPLMFSNIFHSVVFSKAGVVSLNVTPLAGENFFERAINYSVAIQTELRRIWNNGENYLAFKGAFLALDGKFARRVSLPKNLINNDAYLYFKAFKRGYHPVYLPDIVVYYKSPSTFADHLKQSSRFQSSEKELSQYVNINPQEYVMPKMLLITLIIKYFFQNPLLFLGYIVIAVVTKVKRQRHLASRWSIASSTKAAVI